MLFVSKMVERKHRGVNSYFAFTGCIEDKHIPVINPRMLRIYQNRGVPLINSFMCFRHALR